MVSSENKLAFKSMVIIGGFLYVWLLLITFHADNFYPFSRFAMFSKPHKKVCQSYIENEGTIFPTRDEMDLLEIQNISYELRGKTQQACSLIKRQYSYLPKTFIIKVVCNSRNEESGQIEKEFFTAHQC